MKSWTVTDNFGTVHTITADYVMRKEDGHLTFRTNARGSERGELIAEFAPGGWFSCAVVKPSVPAHQPISPAPWDEPRTGDAPAELATTSES